MPYDKTRDLLIDANTEVSLALHRLQPETTQPHSALAHIRSAMDTLHAAEEILLDEVDQADEAEAGNA